MDDELFKVDTDTLTTDRVAVDTAQDPPEEPESKNFSKATYIRLDGIRPSDFTDDEQTDFISTIITELLINYNSGVENVEMIDETVSVIEVHDDME